MNERRALEGRQDDRYSGVHLYTLDSTQITGLRTKDEQKTGTKKKKP